MDYHSIHGHDVSSFDLPSIHRLPAISVAQASKNLADPARYLSTGLEGLDALLAEPPTEVFGHRPGRAHPPGGIQRGLVTEVWGPPGVGKTTLGLHLASSSLCASRGVVWVDAIHSLCPGRLVGIMDINGCDNMKTTGNGPGNSGSTEDSKALDKFLHFTCPSLPHLIALLCRPNLACVPPGTSLIVVDSLSALISHAFPRTVDPKAGIKRGNKVPSLSARRQQTLQYIIGALQKLAAARDLAVVILTQCATKMHVERGAALVPAMNAAAWEEGISTRIVLFRDWSMQHGSVTAARFAAVLKLNDTRTSERYPRLTAFKIGPTGLIAVSPESAQPPVTVSSTPRPKRKRGDTDFEIPDSDEDDDEDEDYGWQDEDAEAMPSMPPQWQGSEDILLGQPNDSDGHEDDDYSVDDERRDDDTGSASPEKAVTPGDGKLPTHDGRGLQLVQDEDEK